MSSSFSCVVPVCERKLRCIRHADGPARLHRLARALRRRYHMECPTSDPPLQPRPAPPSGASAPSRSVERHRRRRRHHHRFGDLPNAGQRHESIARSASTLRRVDRGRNRRAVRRADAGRGRRRVPRDRWNLRLHSQRVGTSSGVPFRLGGTGDHSRGGARRDRDDFRRIPVESARIQSEPRAVRRLGPLRRGARHRGHRRVELRRRAVGFAAPEHHDGREVLRSAVHRDRRDRDRDSEDRRPFHARRSRRGVSRSRRLGWRSCRCSGRTTGGPTSRSFPAR